MIDLLHSVIVAAYAASFASAAPQPAWRRSGQNTKLLTDPTVMQQYWGSSILVAKLQVFSYPNHI